MPSQQLPWKMIARLGLGAEDVDELVGGRPLIIAARIASTIGSEIELAVDILRNNMDIF
jgi:hypothetical protein